MEYVPIKAKAGYRSGYSNPEYISSLPKYSIPNLPKQGTFRIFPTEGDSMFPIPEGSDIAAEYIEDWNGIKPKTPCIVVLNNNQDFVFKMVSVQEKKTILLESMNHLYEPYTVDISDVLEIWKFNSFISRNIPLEVSDLSILFRELQSIKSEIRKRK